MTSYKHSRLAILPAPPFSCGAVSTIRRKRFLRGLPLRRRHARAGITWFASESCYRMTLTSRGKRELRGAMSMETQRLPGRLDWDSLAADALELARMMPPGPERNQALK